MDHRPVPALGTLSTDAPHAPLHPVQPARLSWQEGRPYANQFQDIYYAADGPAEVARVFVGPSALAERFAALPPDSTFTLGELGFGSGLNIAVCVAEFLARAPTSCRLHVISMELHPLQLVDMQRCRDHWQHQAPRLGKFYTELCTQYPPLIAGWHRRELAGGRICLSLYWGDASTGLAGILPDQPGGQRRPVDAWLLDGFAPDRNPAMWSPLLCQHLARLASAGTSLATFTAAGQVRRNLTAAGFQMQRLDQRPHKRHSLLGWYQGPQRSTVLPSTAWIVGAGLAGAATARALANRSLRIQLLEAGAQPVNALAATLMHPRLAASQYPPTQLRLRAFDFGSHWLSAQLQDAPSGVLQLPAEGMPLARLEAVFAAGGGLMPWLRWCDPATASALAGLAIRSPALHFSNSRMLNLNQLCAQLRKHPAINYQPNTQVQTLQAHANGWRLQTAAAATDLNAADQALVICSGASRQFLPAADYLELLPVWGQFDQVRLHSQPRLPLVGDGLVAPLADGSCALGATYEYQPWEVPRASATNLARLHEFWQDAAGLQLAAHLPTPMRGQRGVTSDRLPIWGPLLDAGNSALPGIWLNLGHGSSGTSLIPYLADALASEMCGELVTLPAALRPLISSLRFRQRQRRRGPRHGASNQGAASRG